MNNKFKLRLIFSIYVMLRNIEEHRNVWKKEIEEKDGYLKPSLKATLTQMRNILHGLSEKYGTPPIREQEVDRMINDTYNHIAVTNARNKDKKQFDFEKEKLTLPSQFLDSLLSYHATLEYSTEKYKKTIQDEKLEKEFNKLKNLSKRYFSFVEDEIIITN